MWWPEIGRFGGTFEPWRDIQRMQNEMNRLLEGITVPYASDFPEINIWAGESDLIITSEIPGIDPGTLDISLKGDSLTIRGSRNPEELKEGETYHRQERSHGNFAKVIRLPFAANFSKVEAKYEKGILMMKLPRPEEQQPKKIQIKAS